MAVIETWLKTDLKSIVRVNAIHGNVFSQDNMANLIGVELLDGGEPATVTGSVSANVLRANGTTVAVAGTLSGNKASVTLPQAAYAVPGMLAIVIKLTDSSTVTTIGAIQAVVYRSSTDTIVDPGTIIPSISTLIAAIDAAVDSIPPDYSALTGEVSDLKTAIALTNEGVEPYFIPQFSSIPADDWELGGISSAGEEVSGNYIMRTKKYYPYNPLCEYQYKPLSTATVRFAVFYNDQFGFLERSNSSDIQRENAHFVRFTYGFGASSGNVINDTVKATLASEFGVTITPYIDPEKVKAVADRPVTLSSDVGAMLDVAEGYFKQAYDSSTHLVYDSTHGLFAPQTTSSQSGETGYPAIVCSQFSQALLMGIRYDQSRYVLQNNHRAGWGYITDGTGDYVYTSDDISDNCSLDYMIAKQQLKYAIDHGWAYEITDIRKQIRPGDFLFYGLSNVSSWEDITHVAICLHVGLDDNNMINIESDDLLFGTKRVGVGIKRFPIERSGGHYLYGARFPILPSLISPTLILSDKNLSGTNTSYAIKQYSLNGDHPSGFYTAVIDGSFAAGRVEVGLHYSDTAENTFDYSRGRVVKNAGRCAVTFYADRNFNQVRLGATANNAYTVNKFCLFKGYYGQDWILPV